MKIIIVGAGLAGCTCARLLADKGFKVELYEKESHIGGLLYDKDGDDIFQHYGPHIFHTSNSKVISFILRFAKWEGFCNRPISITEKGFARLPISIETIADLKGDKLGKYEYDFQAEESLIYKNIIKGYSKKQWGKENDEAIKRLKVSNTISGSYFNDVFEGLPKDGFYNFLNKMIDNKRIILHLNTKIIGLNNKNNILIWTAPIDEHLDIPIKLKWYGTKFERKKDCTNYLTAVYNYNISSIPYTRSTKMALLTGCKSQDVLYERPRASLDKHYIIISDLEKKRLETARKRLEAQNVYFCGREGTASYLDMDDVIEQALNLIKTIYKKLKM